jgi:AcrR family transcriptional regulator
MLIKTAMGISERKERERQIKKAAILDASVKLFKEKGFLNVTMNDIAAYAEVSPGSIYLQYKSKDDIYAAIADLGTVKVDELLEKHFILNKHLSLNDIKDIIKGFISIYSEFGVYFDVLLLNYKGKLIFPELSKEVTSNLRNGASKTLLRTVEYFLSVTKNKDIDVLKSKILLCWGILLGTAQLLDAVGRKELMDEEDVERVLDECACAVQRTIFGGECHSKNK